MHAGFLALISICVFGNHFADAITLLGWGYWNTVICCIGFLLNGLFSGCLLCCYPISEKSDDVVEVEAPPPKKNISEVEEKPSPQDGSENLAYVPTAAVDTARTPYNPRDSKLSYAESINSSIAGGSMVGFGVLGQPSAPPLAQDDVSIGPVGSSSRAYYFSGKKPEEPKKPLPVAPKPSMETSKPQYYTAPTPQATVYATPSSQSQPEQSTYKPPPYYTQPSAIHSESDV
jgi:hypothetical protein